MNNNMTNKLTILAGLAIASATLIPAFNQATQAQAPPVQSSNCVYLREVTTGKSVIRKVVATANTNANVDFAVPSGIPFRSYIAEFLPENNARFRVAVNFRFADNTTSNAITRDLNPARRFFLYNVQLVSSTGQIPFQVNTNVVGQRNTAYAVAVLACQ